MSVQEFAKNATTRIIFQIIGWPRFPWKFGSLNEASNHIVTLIARLVLRTETARLDLCSVRPFFGRVCFESVLVYIGDSHSNIQHMLDMVKIAACSLKQMGKHMI